MRIKKLIIGLIVGASLIGGSVSVGAWNGNTAASPETYRCTQVNTTPGNLGNNGGPIFIFGNTTCTNNFLL
jgi:hypothetical protein